MSEDIYYTDATTLAERIRTKAISPVDVVKAHLDRIDAINPKLNAIVALAETSISQAQEAEQAIMKGEIRGPLHGVPFTIKDCIDTVGIRSTRGSKLFEDYFPNTNATVVDRLIAAGGILIGKTNMPEFALWWETDNLVYGRTENPWKYGTTPGGSSGGEAASIAAGLSPLGIGSDLGGSIREPAHYCGIVGLKATHGRVPLTGHWPETLLRFMHVGPMARSVRDIALTLPIISGPDGIDPYAVPMPVEQFEHLGTLLPNLKIGWCPEGPFAPVSTEVQQTVAAAAETFRDLGCSVQQVELPSWEELQPQNISLVIVAVEGTPYLAPLISGREQLLAPSMQRRLKLAAPTLKEYLEATTNCEILRQDMMRYFSEYDLLLCPTGPIPAHPHNSIELDVDGKKVSGRNALGITIPFDLTGSPAISVPFGVSSDGLPIGIQLVARHFDERTLLHAASALETLKEQNGRHPPI